jgi:hypothetical protein
MNDELQYQDELLAFFKAMANVDRLKIAGLLASEALNAAQVAERLHIQPTQVLRHIEQMENLGLVRPVDCGPLASKEPPRFRLQPEALEAMSKRVLAGRRPAARAEDFEGEAFDRKVLSDFMTPDGKLKSIPSQEKKRMAVLRHLAQAFQPGERYTEKQVNELLKQFNPDTASLRRYLVDSGLLAREQSIYWKI